IDQRHAERYARAYRLFFNSLRMPSLSEMPSTLTDCGNGGAVWKRYSASCRFRCRAYGGEGGQRHTECRATSTELTSSQQIPFPNVHFRTASIATVARNMLALLMSGLRKQRNPSQRF